MVSFSADVTDPPSVSTNSPVRTLRNWAGYILVAGLMFVALGVAQSTVAPAVGSLVSSLTGANTGQDLGPVQFGDP
jgi:hypothetical protein